MGYCDRRIALWTKYKTDLAIRMLPNDVRSKSKSDHSGSMMTSMKSAIGASMKKPRSQQNRSQSRLESSVCIDGGNDIPTSGTAGLPPRDAPVSSAFNPYNSGKEPGEKEKESDNNKTNAPKVVPLRSGGSFSSQRKDHSSKPYPAAGGGSVKGGPAYPRILPAIDSGDDD